MNQRSPLATTLQDRGTLVQLFVAAVILGLGVNLLASAIFDALTGEAVALWVLACSLVLLSIALIAKHTIPTRKVDQKLSGFIVFRRETSELISVPRYDYGNDLESFIEGLFAENAAPKQLWESDPVHKGFEFDPATHTCTQRQTEAGKLIVEATEYYVLEKLSTHLTDFFNHSKLDKAQLKELTREDVASIVFKNRFLDTFSRPMRERAAFVSDASRKEEDAERIVASFGPNGIRYSKFDLILPTGAKVHRLSPGSISIDTPKFDLKVTVTFAGYGTNLPRGFEELYLGDVKFSDLSVYKVDLATCVEFKRWSLLSRSGWDYHAWLDSFLQDLEKDFDKEAFLNSICWETALTVARLVERTISISAGSKST